MRFVDTNVLLYLVSKEPSEAQKAEAAAVLLDSEDLALSVQVLQEFYVQSTRRRSGESGLTHQEAVKMIESLLLRFPVQEMNVAVFQGALDTRQRYGISFWDASILEAARMLGCETVLSEDLSDRQAYGNVRVVNPFRR